jgi:predicted amidophosphoribosyltransferase
MIVVKVPMTQLLEKAFAEAAKLSEQDQDEIAEIVLAELASEERWNELFAKSQDLLAKLSEETIAELSKGD